MNSSGHTESVDGQRSGDHSADRASPPGSPPPISARNYVRPPWWRRRYVVNRDLQLRFAWSAVLVGLVSSSVSSFMILLAFWSFNIWQGQRLPAPVVMTIGVVMLTNVMGIYVVAVLTTQRIVGPLFNLMRQFQEVARHNLTVRAHFRKRDELQYVARRFNEMVDSLESHDRAIYGRLFAIESKLIHLLDKADSSDAATLRASLVETKAALREIIADERFSSIRATANSASVGS
jgi:methyl-accepting chemotaxis protein